VVSKILSKIKKCKLEYTLATKPLTLSSTVVAASGNPKKRAAALPSSVLTALETKVCQLHGFRKRLIRVLG
jgi:hypothetical protein